MPKKHKKQKFDKRSKKMQTSKSSPVVEKTKDIPDLTTKFQKMSAASAANVLNTIFDDAINYRSSDIHFQPQESEVIVRFRVDGVLHKAGELKKDLYENILNRIKVQAHLRIDEHFSAQDGALRYNVEGKNIDMRISIVPTLDGEKVTIRILSGYVKDMSLENLGLCDEHKKKIMRAAKKPFGMILVTGPTGSGKSTTLYAVLKMLHRPEVNITTIEDPVEYKLIGANQIQVNKQTNITFAEGLRSIVRQDPDIILVGEIRDRETAEIGVNAALTGHLLLSTFHTNDAATAIPRLLHMEIEPFLLASTLETIIAQRLVRRICEKCKVKKEISGKKISELFENARKYIRENKITLFEGRGCKACNNTGYSGRIAIFEFIEVTREMEELIIRNPSTKDVWSLANKQGAKSLFEDGLEKAKRGMTTIDEVIRVTAPPEAE